MPWQKAHNEQHFYWNGKSISKSHAYPSLPWICGFSSRCLDVSNSMCNRINLYSKLVGCGKKRLLCRRDYHNDNPFGTSRISTIYFVCSFIFTSVVFFGVSLNFVAIAHQTNVYFRVSVSVFFRFNQFVATTDCLTVLNGRTCCLALSVSVTVYLVVVVFVVISNILLFLPAF